MQVQFKVLGLMSGAALLLAWSSYRSMPISESEAIRRAEEFIVRNGYTDLPPDLSRKLTPEPIVFFSNVKEELEFRHDTLERKAVYAVRHGGGWTVAFRQKSQLKSNHESFRGVIMDVKGDHIHVMHQDVW